MCKTIREQHDPIKYERNDANNVRITRRMLALAPVHIPQGVYEFAVQQRRHFAVTPSRSLKVCNLYARLARFKVEIKRSALLLLDKSAKADAILCFTTLLVIKSIKTSWS